MMEASNGGQCVLGFRQSSLRGLEKIESELKLVCLALNLSAMCRLRGT